MRVVVVGAGVAGLVAARDLAAAGADVVVLEAGDRIGGVVAGHEVDGLRLDAGAESFATRSPVVADLLGELGLADDVVLPRPGGAWVHLGGRRERTVPLPTTGALGIPGDPWAADVRRAVGTAGALRARLDRHLPAGVGTGGSLGTLVRRRLGRRVLDRLVAPVVSGVHATHPDDADVDAVLPGLSALLAEEGSLSGAVARLRRAAPAGSAVAGLRGGLNRLPGALAEDLAGRGVVVEHGAPVEELHRDGDAWLVRGPAGDVRADHVVVATSGPVAVRLLGEHVPAVAPLGVSGPRVVLATLVVRAPALDDAPRGTGVLVAAGTSVRAKALTHATAKWPWLAETAGDRHVLRLSYSPVGADDPAGWSEERLTRTAHQDAARLLGVPVPEPVGSARTVWEQGLPATTPGRAAHVAATRAGLAAVPGLHAAGAWLAGTGLVAVVGDARRVARGIVDVHS